MEQKGSRKRPADQLQGPAVQDQTVRLESEIGMTPAEPAEQNDMLVIQFGYRTVKGYTDIRQWPSAQTHHLGDKRPWFRRIGGSGPEDIPLEGVKAIFFVKSFEGKWHDDLRFHDHLAAPDCLWVRVTFNDGEIIEGL